MKKLERLKELSRQYNLGQISVDRYRAAITLQLARATMPELIEIANYFNPSS